MDQPSPLAVLAQHLNDNLGNRLTPALANGLLMAMDAAMKASSPPAPTDSPTA